jgi:hypothetical protein
MISGDSEVWGLGKEFGEGCANEVIYSESSRGIGPLIGEFRGPVWGEFVKSWAAFYECWNEADGIGR